MRRAVHLSGSRLKQAVLSCLLLQVEVEVTVVVALLLVVDGRIGQRQLLADRGHEIRRALYHGVALQRAPEVIDGALVILQHPVALGQRAVAASYLVDIAIAEEDIERALRQIAGQQRVGHIVDVDKLQPAAIVVKEFRPRLRIGQVLTDRLQAVGLPIRIIGVDGKEETVQQVFYFVLRDFVWVSVAQHASRTDVVIIVEQLGGIGIDHPLWVDLIEGIVGLAGQSHIIEVSGQNNMVFAEGIDHALLLVGIELALFFLYSFQSPLGPLAEVVEVLVARLPLAEAHQLDVAYEKFYLVVGGLRDTLQQTVGTLIVHVCDVDKGQSVQCLGLTTVVSPFAGE